MAGGNNIVVKTINEVSYKTDAKSYADAIKKLKSVKKEWEKANKPTTRGRNGPAKQYDEAARQMKLINKRLEETKRKEEAKSTAHAIAQAKKQAAAQKAIDKQQAARMRQQMQQMTQQNREAAKMKKFYEQQERAARRAARKMNPAATPRGPMSIRRINSMQITGAGALGGGMVGNKGPYSPETIARQNAAMAGRVRMESKIADIKRKTAEREAKANASKASRMDDVIAQNRIRLSSKYGRDYGSKLGRNGAGNGIQELNNQLKRGTLSLGQYRQQVAALERQLRSAQGAASGFGSSLGSIRGGLIGGGLAMGAFTGGKSIMEAGQFFQGMDATMTMVSDTEEEAKKRIAFLKEQTNRLGLDMKIASQGYVQMSVNSEGVMSKNQNDELFKGFSEYATALQVDPVKFQRGITAIGQMMGKGQVMAEELKGQWTIV